MSSAARLQVDRDQLAKFLDLMFRYADDGGFLSLRCFFDDRDGVDKIRGCRMNGDAQGTLQEVAAVASYAANHPHRVVFAPPVALFANAKGATEKDLANGVALSVECDNAPGQARAHLEALLGPATVVVASGGSWTDPATGEVECKLHLHWRLTEPTRTPEEHAQLKRARFLAQRVAGADASTIPLVHPLRWPGSWHRKAEPRLCEIIDTAAAAEVDLGETLERLEEAAAARGAGARAGNGQDYGHDGDRAMEELVRRILTGEEYHCALRDLAFRHVKAGMPAGQVVQTLRGLMDASTGPRDERWRQRRKQIPMLVDTAIKKLEEQAAEEPEGEEPGEVTRTARQVAIGSDIEIAECVRQDLEEDFGAIVACEGALWRWLGTHWAPIPEHKRRCAVHLYDGAPYRMPRGEPSCVKLTKTRVDSVLSELGAILADPEFFARQAIGINCASGFIRFSRDGNPTLEPHARDHRCRHVLPGRWQVGSEAMPPDGSLLAALLGGIFHGDPDEPEKLDLIQESIGVAATGYATRLVQPKAVILKGERAENGKSQVLDIARGVLPPTAIASVTASRMGDERHIVGLVGKLLNASDELSSAQAIASETFKTIVTGEPVSGRDVYSSRVEFRSVAQHLFATNTLPAFTGGMDRGVQRRLLVVTFNRVIPEKERIEDIGKRIGEEEPDLLLGWVVEGAARAIRRRGFFVPGSSVGALREWLYSADPVLGWLDECVEIHEIENNHPRVTTRDAYSRFHAWAVDAGFKKELLPAINGFVQRVKANAVGVICHRLEAGRFFIGVVVK